MKRAGAHSLILGLHSRSPSGGFELKGDAGPISSYDFEPTIRVQTAVHPAGKDVAVDVLQPPMQDPIQYFVNCIQQGTAVEGPLSPKIARIGQQIVDTAVRSAQTKKTVKLLN